MTVENRLNVRYDDKFKQKVLTEHSNGASIIDLSKKYGISFSTIYNWRKKNTAVKEHVGEICDVNVNDHEVKKKPVKTFVKKDSKYVILLDFNYRRSVLREIEIIADINERTVEQQIIYMCKKMKEALA